jgi:aminopeptidase
VNESALHLDLVCDLREDGEVYADGEVVWRAGRFLEPAAAPVES